MAVFDKITGINVASGFKLQAKAPLDGRLVVESIADRDALITENGAYEGMKVYVKSVGISYVLKGTTNNDWRTDGMPVVEVFPDCGEIAKNNGAYDSMVAYVISEAAFYRYNKSSNTWDDASQDVLYAFYSNGYAGIDEITRALNLTLEAVSGSQNTDELPGKENNLLKQLNEKLAASQKGKANGVAELDSTGKVLVAQLPGSVTSAEKNTIVGVQKNGTDLTPDANRKVNVEVPTKVSELTNDSGFTKVEKSTTNGNVKIGGTETAVYAHPTTAGNKHIPAGGAANKTLQYKADGEAQWGHTVLSDVPANAKFTDTTYTAATTAKDGLMSAADKVRVDAMPSITVSAAAPTEAVPNSLWFGID